LIQVRGLFKSFGGVPVLSDVSFDVQRGEHVALIGPSGVGKSLLLRCLNGLTQPDSGSIALGGLPLTTGNTAFDKKAGAKSEAMRARLLTGMVFQQFNLFTHLNAIDNIVLAPVRALKLPVKQAIERAESLLEFVGLSDKRDRYPAELSGGQQQRVAIARALAMEPEILLFDEPTSALDPVVAEEILNLIIKISGGKTVLVVSHEIWFIRQIADRVFFIEDATIYEEGPPNDLLDHPKREKTRAFLGCFNEG